MSKIFFLIFTLILINNFSLNSDEYRTENEIKKSPENIIEYFLIFPGKSKSFPDGIYYEQMKDFESKKKTLIKSKSRNVIIDNENYYLKTITQQNPMTETVVLTQFLRKNKIPIIAVTQIQIFISSEFYLTNFYIYKNSSWTNVNKYVLPQINFNTFWGEQNRPAFKEHYNIISLDYILPQYGTNVIVILRPAGGPGPLEEIPEDELKKFDFTNYYDLFKKIKYIALEMKWDWKEGIFIITKKIENTEKNRKLYFDKSYNNSMEDFK